MMKEFSRRLSAVEEKIGTPTDANLAERLKLLTDEELDTMIRVMTENYGDWDAAIKRLTPEDAAILGPAFGRIGWAELQEKVEALLAEQREE